MLRMNQPNTTRIRLNGGAVPDVTTTLADGRDPGADAIVFL
mgnify:CR=1 FL=1